MGKKQQMSLFDPFLQQKRREAFEPIRVMRGTVKRPPFITETMIKDAIEHSNSGMQAANYLRVCYNTLKKYAKLYGIWDQIKWYPKKGVVLTRNYATRGHALRDILGTEDNPQGKFAGYNRYVLKNRLITAGLLEERCAICGYNEKRMVDKRSPLRLVNRNGKLTDLRLSNLELVCLNCDFLLQNPKDRYTRQGRQGGKDAEEDLLTSQNITFEQIHSLVRDIKDDLAEDEDTDDDEYRCPHGNRWANCEACYFESTKMPE